MPQFQLHIPFSSLVQRNYLKACRVGRTKDNKMIYENVGQLLIKLIICYN